MRDNLIAHQGVPFAYGWPVTDDEGVPLDLSGWTIRSQVRPSADADVVFHEFSQPGRTDGLAVISATAIETTGWTWDHGVYDVIAVPPDGDPGFVGGGAIRVRPRVTR